MTTLSAASHEWATRPNDERFCSLYQLGAKLNHDRAISRAKVVSSRKLSFQPDPESGMKGLQVVGPEGHAFNATHWSFGQMASLAGAPAGYLRTLPAPLAADAMNYGFKFARDVADVGVLIRRNGGPGHVMAATGPNYGRVWNADIADALIARFGDGVSGDWRVPGEFGVAVKKVTKDNTTLYASDRDMFVFLADEVNRVTIQNRRDGKSGTLARGFYVKNSEVGSSTLTIAMFLFDYACMNRTIWGAEQVNEISIRHTAKAPDRWLEDVMPVITKMASASAKPIEETLKAAQEAKIESLDTWLATKRFTKSEVTGMKLSYLVDEGKPLGDTPSIWDVTVAATAMARRITWQDERVDLERRAGRLLELVAA